MAEAKDPREDIRLIEGLVRSQSDRISLGRGWLVVVPVPTIPSGASFLAWLSMVKCVRL